MVHIIIKYLKWCASYCEDLETSSHNKQSAESVRVLVLGGFAVTLPTQDRPVSSQFKGFKDKQTREITQVNISYLFK